MEGPSGEAQKVLAEHFLGTREFDSLETRRAECEPDRNGPEGRLHVGQGVPSGDGLFQPLDLTAPVSAGACDSAVEPQGSDSESIGRGESGAA
jgi:hypothetical protein